MTPNRRWPARGNNQNIRLKGGLRPAFFIGVEDSYKRRGVARYNIEIDIS